MTSEFFFSHGRLNLASFIQKKKEEVAHQNELQEIESVEIFEYRKNEDGYWDGAKQVVNKALSIAEALYS